MIKYQILETDAFLADVEEAAVWILLTNIEQSVEFAEQKVDEFQTEIETLSERLGDFPESGERADSLDIRKFPVYCGRYSMKWLVNHVEKTVTLLTLSDLKYPKSLREVELDE